MECLIDKDNKVVSWTAGVYCDRTIPDIKQFKTLPKNYEVELLYDNGDIKETAIPKVDNRTKIKALEVLGLTEQNIDKIKKLK